MFELPSLKEGYQYRIILRQPEFSLSKEFWKRNVSGGVFPKINIPNDCICCNKRADYFKSVNPVLNNQELVTPFELPVCRTCENHAVADTQANLVGGILFVIGFLGAASAPVFFISNSLDLISAAVLFCVSALVFYAGFRIWKFQRNKQTNPIHGHHPGTSFIVRYHHELIIESSNKQLVQNILSNHESIVWYLGTTESAMPLD